MIKKNGFISISIIYSFFIVFMLLLVLVMSTYVNNRTQSTIYKNDIKMKNTSTKKMQLNDYIRANTNSGKGIYTVGQDYIYRGPSVNNYVMFNGEKWRIIGVFSDNSHGVNQEYLTKIVRVNALDSTLMFDNKSGNADKNIGLSDQADGSNNWSDSQLNFLLNPRIYVNSSYKDNKILTNYEISSDFVIDRQTNFNASNVFTENYIVKLYRNMGSYFESQYTTSYKPEKVTFSSQFVGINFNITSRIKSSYEGYIQEATWHTGAINVSNVTSSANKNKFYAEERGTQVSDPTLHATSFKGLVGIIYASDYHRADYSGNWMTSGFKNDWTMSHLKNSKNKAISISADGTTFETTNVNSSKKVHPVVYLKTDVRIDSGAGTNSSPYIITR